jgi:glutamyl-tRNA synthetase
MKERIRKYVLKNALDFGGSVNNKVVLGLVLRNNPDLKKDVPAVLKEIDSVIKDVQKLSPEEIKVELEKAAPELLTEKKEKAPEGPLKELPNAKKGKVVVRIAPSPSGPLHIGHAYGASLNYEYAKMYDGKLLLRIEDTNPENIYTKAYELIPEDVNWLTDNGVEKVIIQSERLKIYHEHAEKLVKQGNAYVCTCNADEWREKKNDGEACECQSVGSSEHETRYKKMFTEYAEGEAVLRLKTDIQHKNPAMRDFALMRVNEHIHPKTGKKERVWPLMVFSVAVDDHDYGVTHVLNGKDHTDNGKKETMILDCFKWKHPEYKHWGKINFTGMKISSSETRVKIEQNEYHGWDDPRLPFLPALRKRGYQPEAFRRFAVEVGLSLNDKTVSREEFWKMVNAFNKEIVEKEANRYFFADNQVKLTINGLEKKEVEIDLHPDSPDRGTRKLNVGNTVYIAQSDLKQLGEGYVHRLMDCCNFRFEGKRFEFVSEDYEEFKEAPDKGKIIHWVPTEDFVEVEVEMDDGRKLEGVGEEALKCAGEGSIVQLERRFFARVDKIDKDNVRLLYLHT